LRGGAHGLKFGCAIPRVGGAHRGHLFRSGFGRSDEWRVEKPQCPVVEALAIFVRRVIRKWLRYVLISTWLGIESIADILANHDMNSQLLNPSEESS
jgi:hypothetical protein